MYCRSSSYMSLTIGVGVGVFFIGRLLCFSLFLFATNRSMGHRRKLAFVLGMLFFFCLGKQSMAKCLVSTYVLLSPLKLSFDLLTLYSSDILWEV